MTRSALNSSLAIGLTVVAAACSGDVVVAPQTSSTTSTSLDSAHAMAIASTRSTPFWGGVFLGESESTPERVYGALQQFTQATGKRPALVKTFHNLDAALSETGWAGKVLRAISGSGSTNYVALDLNWGGRPSGSLLEAIARGEADVAIDRAARSLSTVTGTVLVEPAWEMNGNWNYAWQGVSNGNAAGPQLYVNAWRRVVDRFRAAGATNVRWVWNPNTGNPLAAPGAGASHWNWYANYFPGDAYVDFVGAHGYNGPTAFNSTYHTFADLFNGADADYMLRDLKSRYPDKPIILGEMADEQGSSKATWIRDAYASMLKDPQIAGAVWFNMNKEADWRITSSPDATAAYKQIMLLSAVKDRYDDTVLRKVAVMVAQR
jgi:beta-mannanase